MKDAKMDFSQLSNSSFPSFRRRPESRISLKSMDSGLRRNDGYKVNGTAVIFTLRELCGETIRIIEKEIR